MTYANYQDKLAAMRRYAKTPAGKAAKKRSRQRCAAKGQAPRIEELIVNTAPLALALMNWRTQ